MRGAWHGKTDGVGSSVDCGVRCDGCGDGAGDRYISVR